MTDPIYFTGRCLLALPGMGDPRFEQAVIAICMHDENGAMGIDLGRTVDGVHAAEVFIQLGLEGAQDMGEQPLFQGGPVEMERGFVLHSLDYSRGDTVDVAGRWGLTSSLTILADIAAGNGPVRWRLALGYSGWDAGQLEEELTRHGWLIADCDKEVLFAAPPEELWQAAYRSAGIDPAMLSSGFGAA